MLKASYVLLSGFCNNNKLVRDQSKWEEQGIGYYLVSKLLIIKFYKVTKYY